MKMKEYGSAHEMSSIQRTRRITEIQEELLGLREIVDSNYHLTNPDGEDTGEYANTITDTILELEAELEKLFSSPNSTSIPETVTHTDDGDFEKLSRDELQSVVSELRKKVLFLNRQSDSDAHEFQKQLEIAEEALKRK